MTEEKVKFAFLSVIYNLQVTLGLTLEESEVIIMALAQNIVEDGMVGITAEGAEEFKKLSKQKTS